MGYVTDGKPPEAPLDAANEAYAMTPPAFGETFGQQVVETSPIAFYKRWLERGVAGQGGLSGFLSRGQTQVAGQEGGMSPEEMGLTAEGGAPPSPTISAEDANEKYAPIGPDGKKVKIASAPMPENLARVVGQQKAEQIEREGIIARFQNAHSWPVNFAVGTAAFMMDPFNLATAFVPGFGEEAVSAALGRGLLARTAGRVVAGATGGALSQLPLTALRYGMANEEASEYTARDALRDLSFAAAGNAVIGAGIVGGLREAGVLKPDELMTRAGRPVANEGAGAAILKADAGTKHAAMSTAVAQLADGREVDVEPLNAEAQRGPSAVAADQAKLYREGFDQSLAQPEYERAAQEVYGEKKIAPPTEPGQRLALAENDLKAMEERGVEIHPEDRAEIEAARGDLAKADDLEGAAQIAAGCLGDAA